MREKQRSQRISGNTKNHILEKNTCEAFLIANNSFVLKDVTETFKEVEIELTDFSCRFIHAKKNAFQVAETTTTVCKLRSMRKQTDKYNDQYQSNSLSYIIQ